MGNIFRLSLGTWYSKMVVASSLALSVTINLASATIYLERAPTGDNTKSVIESENSEHSKDKKSDKGGKFEGSYLVTISTTMGDIEVLLYDQTPLHRNNFLNLIEEDFYSGVLFHRVINGFVIQAGDPESRGAEPNIRLGEESYGSTIEAEILPEAVHHRGVLAAAREGDNKNPDRRSSGSHFYIALTDTPHLDGAYTIFGEMTKGEKVIEKIAQVEVDENNRPLTDVVINEVTLKKLSKPRKSKIE